MAAIGSDRAHALVVARQRAGDRELAAAAIVFADFLDGRGLGRDLGALLGDRLVFLLVDRAAAARGGRGRSRDRRRGGDRGIGFVLAARQLFFGEIGRAHV